MTDSPDRTALTRGATELATAAQALANIVTREDADAAGLFLRGVRSRIRLIERHYEPIRKAVRGKMNEALTEIKRLESEDLRPWEDADAKIADRLEEWILADRKATEEQNRARLAIAEAEARVERDRQAEALRAAATVAPTVRDRKALESQARQVDRSTPMPTITGMVEPAKIAGISTPTRQVAEVTNLKELLRGIVSGKVPEAAIKVDQSWLDEQATARGKDLNFPGVVVRDKVSLSARSL